MKLLKTKAELRHEIARVRVGGASIGLVPTMGYLHEGHLSVVRRARAENEEVVVSIFLNPTQFGPNEDLDRYPRDLERDLELAEEAGTTLAFCPEVREMYAPDACTWVEVTGLTDRLCGASRRGHFRGVATVVAKLLLLCGPDRAYFGEKDAQQLAVIRRMVRDLDIAVEVVGCPTVREIDGLAMSSRNVNLSPLERAQAPALHRALVAAEHVVRSGAREAAHVRAAAEKVLAEAPLGRVDYIEVVDAADLQPVERIEGETLVALAVWFGGTRLIDNTVVRP